jgi:hypothetical protein
LQQQPAKEIKKHLGNEVNELGYLITTKPVHTIKNETMYFHTFFFCCAPLLSASQKKKVAKKKFMGLK